MKKIPLARPLLGKEELDKIREVFSSGWILNGPFVQEFEKKFREYIGAKFAIAVTSCTAGMDLALKALDVKEGEVILPAFNFIAAGIAVLQNNAKPVFVDVDKKTGNIDPEKLKEKIGKKTKAILICHYAGLPADMKAILEISHDYNIPLIEDAAHALGSEYKGKKIGNFGDVTVFSFGPIKMITTGMGGMITTENQEIDRKIRIMRSYGMDKSAYERETAEKGIPWKYSINTLGHNYRMTDISAAIGLVQLSKLEEFIAQRRKNAEHLTKELGKIKEIIPPTEPEDYKHVYLYYVIKVKNGLRDKLGIELLRRGIGVSVHWDPPLHLHALMRKFGYKEGDFPITEKLSKEVLTLPVGPNLAYKDIEYIANSIKEVLE